MHLLSPPKGEQQHTKHRLVIVDVPISICEFVIWMSQGGKGEKPHLDTVTWGYEWAKDCEKD